MIRRFFTRRERGPAAAEAGARRSRRRRLALEALEHRSLLSTLGPEHQVSFNFPATDNDSSDVATSANGTSVAVWVNAYSSTDHDIWAQRFDSTGQPIGAPIMVDFTTADSDTPRVAMDGQGRFAVTWVDINSSASRSVMMRYFDATGTPVTGITQLTAAGAYDFVPDVAASNGSLVVTWAHVYSGLDIDIYAERFVTSSGIPPAQGIFYVNVDTNYETAPSVAMSPDGRFDIAYERQYSANDYDIFASQYDANGSLVRGNIYINFDSNIEFRPMVAMNAAGDAVVTYERLTNNDFGVYANRLSSGGVVGRMIAVQDAVGVDEFDPTVALAPDGRFAVAYDTFPDGVHVTEIGSDDTVVATVGVADTSSPAIAVDSLGHFVVTYQRFNPTTNHDDIFRRDFLG